MHRGQVAIITGGASGIGLALGKALAQRGIDVVLADRDDEGVERAADELRARGGQATAATLDVRNFEAFETLAHETKRRTGRIDYLFNNAGVGVSGRIADYTPDDWDYVIDVNLRGVAWGVQAIYPIMRAQGFGHIVNTASMAGLVSSPLGSYSMTKHGVVGLSKSLRIEAAFSGVRVSALCPGAIQTPILLGGKYGRKRGKQLSESRVREMWRSMRPMDVDVFAEQVLAGVERNEPIIIVPRWWRAIWALERVSVWLSLRLWGRFAGKTQALLEREGRLAEGPVEEETPRPARASVPRR